MPLSVEAKVLWGKSSYTDPQLWLPLHQHLADTAAIAKLLWDNWLPEGTKNFLAHQRQVFIFLAAAHDLGKATPVFQNKNEPLCARVQARGLPLPILSDSRAFHHTLTGLAIVKRYGLDESLAAIIGGHHGRYPDRSNLPALTNYAANQEYTGFLDERWQAVQKELFDFALDLAEISHQELTQIKLTETQQVVLTGLLIIADWLASDNNRFDLFSSPGQVTALAPERAQTAWQELAWPAPWVAHPPKNIWQRFKIQPRPAQNQVLAAATPISQPGIMVVEAPMGEGKTEIALAAAEILAQKTGKSGVYFALPTMATANAIFARLKKWVAQLGQGQTINLAHSKASLNDSFTLIKEGRFSPNVSDDQDVQGGDNVVVHQWFRGRKTGLLADFVVGTIDQILLAALKTKHLALRHLGLANKVVIIDECHAYDAYMNEYLTRALQWLGQYQVPVIILSATLPAATRQKIIDAYLDTSGTPKIKEPPVWDRPADYVSPTPPPLPTWVTTSAYPVLTYTDQNTVKQLPLSASARESEITLTVQNEAQLVTKLKSLLSAGGCVGVVCNTVTRAQTMFTQLQTAFPDFELKLIHARFLACDRASKEAELVKLLGPSSQRPKKLLVVGTQIIEQSLDIDFDLLVTDLAPMDLLIQRLGRLHRHQHHRRPPLLQTPQCLITGIEDRRAHRFAPNLERIYDRYLLSQTLTLLPDKIKLPVDINPLVQQTYADNNNEHAAKRREYLQKIERQQIKARTFVLRPANQNPSPLDLTDLALNPTNDTKASAMVRDTPDNLEVIVVQELKGEYHLLPWVEKGALLEQTQPPPYHLAKAAATCTINLPHTFCHEKIIDQTIKELETRCHVNAWQESAWLAGQLILVLNSQLETSLLGYNVRYEREQGLLVTKINERH